VGPGRGLKDCLKNLKHFFEFACTNYSICHNPASSLVRDSKCSTFFSARSPPPCLVRLLCRNMLCGCYAIPLAPPYPLCFRRASRYDILRGSVTEVSMSVILQQYEGALGKMKDKFVCLVHCVAYCTCMVHLCVCV
jgi:hypothetical protein